MGDKSDRRRRRRRRRGGQRTFEHLPAMKDEVGGTSCQRVVDQTSDGGGEVRLRRTSRCLMRKRRAQHLSVQPVMPNARLQIVDLGVTTTDVVRMPMFSFEQPANGTFMGRSTRGNPFDAPERRGEGIDQFTLQETNGEMAFASSRAKSIGSERCQRWSIRLTRPTDRHEKRRGLSLHIH